MNTAGERVRVSRQGADGRLVTTEFNLRKIQDGKIADSDLQKDDRIELPPPTKIRSQFKLAGQPLQSGCPFLFRIKRSFG